MDYNSNQTHNRKNNVRINQIRNESEDQRTRRQNRVGLVILGIAVLAFIGGFVVTMDKTPSVGITQAATGQTEAAIAPAAGNATTDTTATSTSSTTASTEPVTENPKVYMSEESCRGSVNGASQPISGGWTPVNPAPEKTAVPEALAPAMTATSPSDSNED